MPVLNIQTLLRTQTDALAQLKTLGVEPKAHPQWPNLLQFTYDQIAAADHKFHPVVVESRGLILDQDQNWHVVAHPFNRFFNQGETGAADIDWSTARVQEKLDGSLMIVYWYAGAWQVATKGSPDAGGNVGEHSFTFAELFWRIADTPLTYNLIPGWTYCFELTSQYNRIVTQQSDNTGNLTLIGVRDQDGAEHPVALWAHCWDVVREFDLSSAADVLAAADALDPAYQEGYVVVDQHWRRIKIKSPRYVLIHHLKDSLHTRGLIELVQRGEDSEVFAYFPDLRVRYDQILAQMQSLGQEIDQCFIQVAVSNTSRKNFALAAQAQVPTLVLGAMFALLDAKQANGFKWLCAQAPARIAEILSLMEVSNDVN